MQSPSSKDKDESMIGTKDSITIKEAAREITLQT
jgi:hypothetical protein